MATMPRTFVITPRLAEACGNVPFSVAFSPDFLRKRSAEHLLPLM